MPVLGYLEHEIMNSYDGPIPGLYKRYIDDAIGVSNLSEKRNYHISGMFWQLSAFD
jgi:hypothetical protein